MLTPEALRAEFLLDPAVTFLNHGSFGACPKPVFAEYQRWQVELERQPVKLLGRDFTGLMQTARARLARYLQTERDNLVFVANATQGINIVARSLALHPGDEILTTNHEYGAIDRTWQFLCAKTGAVYRNVPLPLPFPGETEFVENFWAAVTPRTRVILLSHITSPTALVLPIREILRRARAAGLLTIIDGAHAIGQVPLNLDDLGADFYTSNCHKWLCAPKGSAFLYARPEVQALIEPLVVSWGWHSETPGPSRFVDEQEWTGTRDPAAWLATPAAIDFFEQRDWDAVRADCHTRAVAARERLLALTGRPAICAPDMFSQMFTVQLPACDAVALKARLYDEYKVEVPVLNWRDRVMLRTSIQGYNTQADVDRLLSALERLLPEVQV